MAHHTYHGEVDIFKEKEGGKNFYIIISGLVEVSIGGETKSTLSKGATFGELALLNDSPRTATIRTKADTECWALDRNVFRDMLKRLNKSNYSEIADFVAQVELF